MDRHHNNQEKNNKGTNKTLHRKLKMKQQEAH